MKQWDLADEIKRKLLEAPYEVEIIDYAEPRPSEWVPLRRPEPQRCVQWSELPPVVSTYETRLVIMLGSLYENGPSHYRNRGQTALSSAIPRDALASGELAAEQFQQNKQ